VTELGLSAAEHARLNTFMVDIAGAARGTPVTDNSGNHRFGAKGGLCIYADGGFHDFSGGAREHGFSAFELIQHLYPAEDAVAWAHTWLGAHPGVGAFVQGESDPVDDLADVEAASYAQRLYDGAGALNDTPGYFYITQTRGLPLGLEDAAQLRWIADYRGDEGALLAPVIDGGGKLVRLLVTHVTPDGCKSEHTPARITIRGAKQHGLVRFGSPGPKAVEVEGLEKGLAARAAGAEYVVVAGGVTNLGKVPLSPIVHSVIIARDADPAGSTADLALWRGVVRRLGQGLKVTVTSRPNDIAPKDAPVLKDLDDVWRYDPELVPVLLDGANLEPGLLGDAVDGAILDAASRFDAVELGRARKSIAGLLGIPLGSLDDKLAELVKKRVEGGGEPGDDGLPGKPLTFDEIELWPDPINGAELLTALADAIGKYVIMDAHQRDATALWVVFTHAHDYRDFAPLLIGKSAIKRSGKSRLAEIMERLAPRPLYIAGLTVTFIERAIDDHRPTLIIDEADRIRKGDPALAQRIDAQFNRSFRRQIAKVGKNVPLPGGGYVPRLFSTWAPTFIAGIGKQADTAEDRAVIIALKRKLSTEKVKQLRAKDGADLVVLARKIARFVADNEVRLRTHEPAALDVDNDRAKDVWEPLLAIAETAGGEWPDRARAAAKELAGEAVEEEEEFKVRLLGDIRQLFLDAFPVGHAIYKPGVDGRPSDGPRLSSADMVRRLLAIEDRPYGSLGKAQRPLTQHELGRALREFRIRPGAVRPFNSKTVVVRGYYLRQFEDAFARYLSTPEKTSDFSHPPKSDTSIRNIATNPEKPEENEVFASATNSACSGSENAGNPSNSGVCNAVADQNHENGGAGKNRVVGEGLSTLFPRYPKGRKIQKGGSAAPVDAAPVDAAPVDAAPRSKAP
jgi:Protein of unknown function (DUF3631)